MIKLLGREALEQIIVSLKEENGLRLSFNTMIVVGIHLRESSK